MSFSSALVGRIGKGIQNLLKDDFLSLPSQGFKVVVNKATG